MRNLFLSVLLVFTSIITINAQSNSSETEFGIKGGLNSASIQGDDIGDTESRTSFNLGFLVEIPISEKFSFQPELLYSGQGFDIAERDQDNIFDTDDNIEYQLSYINIPLLFKAYLVDGLSIEAGPQFGFKLHEEIDFEPTSDGGDVEIDDDDSYVKNFDTSFALGTSYKFNSGFFLNARYNFGLTNIYKDDTFLEGVDAKHIVWQFGLGFMF